MPFVAFPIKVMTFHLDNWIHPKQLAAIFFSSVCECVCVCVFSLFHLYYISHQFSALQRVTNFGNSTFIVFTVFQFHIRIISELVFSKLWDSLGVYFMIRGMGSASRLLKVYQIIIFILCICHLIYVYSLYPWLHMDLLQCYNSFALSKQVFAYLISTPIPSKLSWLFAIILPIKRIQRNFCIICASFSFA